MVEETLSSRLMSHSSVATSEPESRAGSKSTWKCAFFWRSEKFSLLFYYPLRYYIVIIIIRGKLAVFEREDVSSHQFDQKGKYLYGYMIKNDKKILAKDLIKKIAV